MLLLDVNKHLGLVCSALRRTKIHTYVHVAKFKYPVFDTNFESHKTSFDILVKVIIYCKHLNMFNFVIIAFIKYILHIILRVLV